MNVVAIFLYRLIIQISDLKVPHGLYGERGVQDYIKVKKSFYCFNIGSYLRTCDKPNKQDPTNGSHMDLQNRACLCFHFL